MLRSPRGPPFERQKQVGGILDFLRDAITPSVSTTVPFSMPVILGREGNPGKEKTQEANSCIGGRPGFLSHALH